MVLNWYLVVSYPAFCGSCILKNGCISCWLEPDMWYTWMLAWLFSASRFWCYKIDTLQPLWPFKIKLFITDFVVDHISSVTVLSPLLQPSYGSLDFVRDNPGEPIPGRKNQSGFPVARENEWQWVHLTHGQICTSPQTDNHATTPPLSFFTGRCPFCRPTSSIKALKAQIIR